MPIGEWLKHDLVAEFEARVRGLDTSLVDITAVLDIYNDHARDSDTHGRFPLAVYVFSVCHDCMCE